MANAVAEPARRRVRWARAIRIVPSRFPPVGVFDRVTAREDLDAVYALEAMTNDRLRDQAGDIRCVDPARRLVGPGSTPVMAAFTHVPPEGSRFAEPPFSAFYCARDESTAIAETRFHREQFLRATHEPATVLEMRAYVTKIDHVFHDIRVGFDAEHDPASYGASRALANRLRDIDSDGLVYRSVRRPGGQCIAAFYPDCVGPCVQGGHFLYRWNGERIDVVAKATA